MSDPYAGYPPPPTYPGYADPAPRRPSAIGPLLAVAGLGIALVGLFALPIQASRQIRGTDVGFVQVRQFAVVLSDHDESATRALMSSLAQFWWRYGLFVAVVALVLIACAATAAPTARVVGLLAAVLAAAAGVLHGLALARSSDYLIATQQFRPQYSMFHDSGLGTWIAFAGLATLAIGGLFIAVLPTLPVRPPRLR